MEQQQQHREWNERKMDVPNKSTNMDWVVFWCFSLETFFTTNIFGKSASKSVIQRAVVCVFRTKSSPGFNINSNDTSKQNWTALLYQMAGLVMPMGTVYHGLGNFESSNGLTDNSPDFIWRSEITVLNNVREQAIEWAYA